MRAAAPDLTAGSVIFLNGAISDIETDKSLRSIATLLALAMVLDAGISDFLPYGETRDMVSATRMKREAGIMQLVHGLSGQELEVALARVEALAEQGAALTMPRKCPTGREAGTRQVIYRPRAFGPKRTLVPTRLVRRVPGFHPCPCKR